jgi:hypothetical protein
VLFQFVGYHSVPSSGLPVTQLPDAAANAALGFSFLRRRAGLIGCRQNRGVCPATDIVPHQCGVFVLVHALERKGIQDQHNGEQAAHRHTENMRGASVVLGHFDRPFIRLNRVSWEHDAEARLRMK